MRIGLPLKREHSRISAAPLTFQLDHPASRSPKGAPADTSRLLWIDVLRGFAACYVLLFHVAELPRYRPQVSAWLSPFVGAGWSGVTLFFVLSAYTLCVTADRRRSDPKWIRCFYVRRVFRIVPLYYVWVAVMAWLTWGTKVPEHARSLLLYAGFGFNLLPEHQNGLVWASWTLGVEMLFYAVFPMIFRVVTAPSRAVGFLIVSFIASTIHYAVVTTWFPESSGRLTYIYFSIFHQLPVFAFGICAFFFGRSLAVTNRIAVNRVVLLLCAVVGALAVPYVTPNLPLLLKTYVMAACYAGIVLAISALPLSTRGTRPLVYLGIISYSLYLNHPLIVYHAASVYRWVYSGGLDSHVALFLCYTLTLIVLVVVSHITFHVIERPGMYLGSWLIKRISTPPEIVRTAGSERRFPTTPKRPSTRD